MCSLGRIGEFVAGRIGVYVRRREIFSFHGAVLIDLTLFEALQGEESNLESWLSATGRFTFFSVRWASMSAIININTQKHNCVFAQKFETGG